jgi:hypothetical protein
LTTLFSDGFESGDFSAWSFTQGTVEVVTTPVHKGTKAMKATFGAGNCGAFEDLGSGYSDLYFRGYLRFPTLPASEMYTDLCSLFPSTFAEFVNLAVYNSGGRMIWFLGYPGGPSYAVATILVDTWYCFELRRLVGDASHGKGTLWIDGVPLLDGQQSDYLRWRCLC